MKAFLLAAGLGTRLKPITENIPKCLVDICGKPLLGWWIDLFEKHNITEVLINLHYLPNLVIDYLDSVKTNIKFKLFYEEQLLGSAGTLKSNIDFIKNEKEFIIAYADNLTNYNLTCLLNFHRQNNKLLTMSLYKTDIPKQKGIVKLNMDNIIVNFEEKPSEPKSNLANAGVYIANPQVMDFINDSKLQDIGFDLLPKLINKMTGWITEDYLMDIGTIEQLELAKIDWKKIITKNN